MKKLLQIIVLILLPFFSFAQLEFGEEQIISDNVAGNYVSYAFDFNNDGNLDALSGSLGGDVLAWYKGDGQGNFGDANNITTSLSNVYFAHAGDLNGDEYLDIVASGDGSVYWYENLGDETFEEHEIQIPLNLAYYVQIADMDGDNDNDIIAVSNGNDFIYIFENIDGQGNFDNSDPIQIGYSDPMFTQAVDMDNDGDLDILSCSRYQNLVDWFENTGGGEFDINPHYVSTIQNPYCVFGVDIDNDSDVDVLATSFTGNKVILYRNEGGSYFEENINDNAQEAQFVYAADLDNDNDYDIISASRGDNKIAWYENIDGNFTGGEKIISIAVGGASMVYAADIDNDADLDVLAAAETGGTISWFKNLSPPIISEQPYDSYSCIGAEAYFYLYAENATSYQWQVSQDNETTFFDIFDDETYSGTTTNELIVSNITPEMEEYIYKCIVCNDDGCVESYTATITIEGTITIAYAGEDAMLCEQTTYNLNANSPSSDNGEYGYWYCENAEVVFTDEYNPQTTVNNLPEGQINIFWVISSSFCSSESEIQINNDTLIDAFTPETDFACENGEYQLYANEPETGTGNWSFMPESSFYVDDISNPFTSIGNLPAGSITCTWTIQNGACVSSRNFILDVIALPYIELGDDIEITEGETINISVESSQDETYLWLPNNETTNNIDVSEEGIYTLIVSNQNCSASDSIKVTYKEEIVDNKRIIPNAFTPNGDGINDTWKIKDPTQENIDVIIIDKNGTTIAKYTTAENSEGWDGTKQGKNLPSDVYWYILNFDSGEKLSGIITLRR